MTEIEFKWLTEPLAVLLTLIPQHYYKYNFLST